MIEKTRKRSIEQNLIPIIISFACFVYFVQYLVKSGEIFGGGSDMVSNTAYGLTMFGDTYRAGWSVPKPSQMILFGLIYRITGDLWYVNISFTVFAALLIYFGCRIMGRKYSVPVPYLVFAAFVVMTPFSIHAAVWGGSGLMNTMFTFAALAFVEDLSRLRNRILFIVFLSAACLTRPDTWVGAYLIIFFVFALKYIPKSRPKFDKLDLLLLIPPTMPLVWGLMDYAAFGNFRYGGWLAQRFAMELATSHAPFDWHKFPGMLKPMFFGTFQVTSWFSPKTIVLIVLSLTGIVTMFIKQRRILLFLACMFFGTIAFYFVTYVKEMLFMGRFLYYNYMSILFVVTIGIAQLTGFVLYIPVKYLRNVLQVALACGIVLFIAYMPFKTVVLKTLAPGLKSRAAVLEKEKRAVKAVAQDAKKENDPVIMTTLQIACSRIALEYRDGKDIYLMERVVGIERLGVKDYLPDLTGRIVYLAYPKSVGGGMRELINRVEKQAKKVETIYEGDGFEIRKCYC